jgi:hypothetical protein
MKFKMAAAPRLSLIEMLSTYIGINKNKTTTTYCS